MDGFGLVVLELDLDTEILASESESLDDVAIKFFLLLLFDLAGATSESLSELHSVTGLKGMSNLLIYGTQNVEQNTQVSLCFGVKYSFPLLSELLKAFGSFGNEPKQSCFVRRVSLALALVLLSSSLVLSVYSSPTKF